MECELCKQIKQDVVSWKFSLGSLINACTKCARQLEIKEIKYMREAQDNFRNEIDRITRD